MARKPSGKKNLSAVGGDLTHDNTKNTLSDDELHALTLQHKRKYEAALAAKKKAAAEFLNCTKLIKAELGDTGLADIKDMIAADGEGFEEKLQAELERKARLARWLGLELGVQADLFQESAPTSQHERGYADGKRAGLAGEVCKPPYGAGTDGYDGYMKGWHEGTAVRSTMAREQEDGAAILMRPVSNEPDGADAFDSAADGAGTNADEATDVGVDPWPDDTAAAANKAEKEPEPA